MLAKKRHYFTDRAANGSRAGVLLGLSLALAAVATTPAMADEISERSAELERVRTRIQALQQTMERERRRKQAFGAELQKIELSLLDLNRKQADAEQEHRKQQAVVANTEQRVREAGQRLRREALALQRQLRAAYVMGRRTPARLVFRQNDPAQAGRALAYYDYLNKARHSRIVELQQQLANLNELRQTVEAQRKKLERAAEKLQAAADAVTKKRDERVSLIDELERKLAAQYRELEQLQQDEARLDELLDDLRTMLADIPVKLGETPSFASLKGKMPWPVDGRILARYGSDKIEGEATWNGILLEADLGDEVRAVAAGRVAYVGWMMRYGLIVVLEHGDGYYSLYGHNRTVSRENGEWVEAGDVIAAAGDSGGQRRSAVYLEVRSSRGTHDPVTFLKRR